MASANKADATSRPSWSKIAASGYIPPNSKPNPPHVQQSSNGAPRQNNSINHVPRSKPSGSGKPKHSDQGEEHELRNVASTSAGILKPSVKPALSYGPEIIMRPAQNEEGSTQLSSDESTKPPSFDSKSVASVATFALDEKESLRPDDSASMRAAIEEEDVLSAPGSVITGSRVGSDFGSKPFREQLQDIPYVTASQARGVIGTLYEPSAPILTSTSGLPTNLISAQPLNISDDAQRDVDSVPIVTPDEKLMDALQSQRDRVWVLKLEQDIIDFVGQSKEASLTLPQCNAFYRMLAHKLADYYRLDHAVAQTVTGAAVVISKTSFARIPPPLSGIAIASNIADTPPLVATARKIMRRNGDPRSENTTAANSEDPSASVSEVGIDVSASDSFSKSKAQLTREQREKQYAEARERIFGKSEFVDGNDVTNGLDEAEQSRSSSAAGKRKNTRKQRNLSNDDFEPRSQFPAFYATSAYGTAPGLQQEQHFYPHFDASHQGQSYALNHPGSSSMMYGMPSSLPTSPDSQGNAWPAQLPSHVYPNGYGQGLPPGYDISAHMQSAMQFQSNSQGNGSIGTNALSPVHQYVSPATPMSPQIHMSSWQQGSTNYHSGYYGQSGGVMAYAEQGIPAMSSYGYNTQPTHDYQQLHHQQFNPQTRAFVPSAANSQYTNAPQMARQFQQFGTLHPVTQTLRNGQSPSQQATIPAAFTSSPGRSPRPVEASVTYSGAAAKSHPNGKVQEQKVRKQLSGAAPSTGDSAMEITTKFGMPSHLPARPPPPKSMEPHKFHEINRGTGGLQAYPGMPRLSSNGMTNNNSSSGNNRVGSSES